MTAARAVVVKKCDRLQQRQRLVEEHHELAMLITRCMFRTIGGSIHLDDLIGAAEEGLVEAALRFDPSRGVPFEAFARIRIRGAIVDAVRAHRWVPTSICRKANILDQARRQASQRAGRAPTVQEVSAELDMTTQQYHRLVDQAQFAQVLSLDAPVNDNREPLSHTVAGQSNPAEPMEKFEVRQAVRQAVDDLPIRQRQVITAYYFEGRKLRDIGTDLGVSESRVCQLCKQALKTLEKRVRALK